jgi:hypothetical protein
VRGVPTKGAAADLGLREMDWRLLLFETLRSEGKELSKLPKREHGSPEWQAAMEANGSVMFARIGVTRGLNRHVERVFDPSRKATHWSRRKLKRDQRPIGNVFSALPQWALFLPKSPLPRGWQSATLRASIISLVAIPPIRPSLISA